MRTFLTSDEHYDHKNIIKFCARPFQDIEHMQREMIARHNAVVLDDDEVWHLGDFALNEKTVPQILPLLKGRHKLVCGNHDRCHPCHKKHEAAKQRYLLYGFETVAQEIRMGPWLLNHLPYVGDSQHEARYPEWRPKDQGSYLIHGHVHESWRIQGRQFNVGVDQWDFAPVALSVLDEIRLGKRPAF